MIDEEMPFGNTSNDPVEHRLHTVRTIQEQGTSLFHLKRLVEKPGEAWISRKKK